MCKPLRLLVLVNKGTAYLLTYKSDACASLSSFFLVRSQMRWEMKASFL